MDWMESLFGWSPDNGDGSFEALVFVSIMAIMMLVILALASRQLRR
jgi:hypothetical protein